MATTYTWTVTNLYTVPTTNEPDYVVTALYNVVGVDGTYTADNDEDEPLKPLARFGFEGRVFCYVYHFGITAVRVGLDGPYKVGRFD